jgi:hypothetical protein
VPYAIVRDTPASWEHYRGLLRELGKSVPKGLLIQVAGPTAEGVREIEIWCSRPDHERYEQQRLARTRGDAAPVREPTVRELTVRHLLRPERRHGEKGETGR